MDGTHVGSEYANGLANRRKKIQIISTNKVESFKRQHYYDSNPYSLNRNPSSPFLHRAQTTPQSVSNRDNCTQTSSQRSGKVIRTNCLTKAQKPNITQSRVGSHPIAPRINTARGGQALSSGYSEHDPNISSVYQQYGIMQGHKQGQQKCHKDCKLIAEEEKRLKEQNSRLKDQLIKMQRNHNQQIMSLKQQLERIFRKVAEMEEKMNAEDREWLQFQQNNEDRSK